MRENFRTWRKKLLAFMRANGGNVAMMFGLSIVPLTIAGGAGLDFARAMMVRSSMADALDAATLAVAATPGISAANAQILAQKYIDANYTQNASQYGTPQVQLPVINSTAQTVQITVTDTMPTTLLSVGNVMPNVNISVSSTVTWGQSKLWVALVLDNTGSMSQTNSTHTSKLTALKTASHNLITTLKNASSTVGDVRMSITPFAKLVNIGTGYINNAAVDWTDWKAQPPGGAPDNTVGPGDACPWSTGSDGFRCVTAADGSSTTSTVPASGSICPSVVSTYTSSGSLAGMGGHYFNGCYTSAATGNTVQVSSGSNATCNGYNNCTCTGSNGSKKCNAKTYNHVWTVASTSNWGGCVEDRNRNGDNGASIDYDTTNTSPTNAASDFSAANDDNCPDTAVTPLPSTWTAAQWDTLDDQIDDMTAQGSTNQTIGLQHGWMTLSSGLGPYSPPALPTNTTQYIILVSDGLNTQDRWYGDGSNQSTSVDGRMSTACTNAKTAGIVIYTIFIDLGGTQGNSTVLQNCATDSTKYFDLTTSNGVITTFNQIAQQITNLRVSR